MKALVLAAIPIIGFVIGVWLGRMGVANKRGDRDVRRELVAAMEREAEARGVIDDLAVMAAEHGALGEPGGVLMGERISEYRKARRNEG